MNLIGYCRFSTDMQRDESILAQKRAIICFAQEKGHTIIDFFVDKAKSGKSAQRPAFLDMIERAKQDDINGVIVHKLDRFSRSVADSTKYRQILSDHSVTLISVEEHLDDTPSGRLKANIISAINSYYVDNLTSEIYKGMKGHSFGKNSLYDLFRNERYKGLYVFNKAQKRKSDGSRCRKQKSDSEIIRIDGGVPAIVDADLWQRVNDKMDRNKKLCGSFKAKETYLLTGLIYFGECGYAMHGNARFPSKTRDKFISYRCNHRDNNQGCKNREIKRDEVESFVIGQLKKHLFNDSVIPALTKQLNQYIIQSSSQANQYREQYEKRLADLEKQKKNIIDAVAMSGMEDAFCEKLAELQKEIALVRENLDSINTDKPVIAITEAQVRQYLDGFKQILKRRDIPQLKKFIDSYVERVEVYQNSVKVKLKIAFAFAGDDREYIFEKRTARNNTKIA